MVNDLQVMTVGNDILLLPWYLTIPVVFMTITEFVDALIIFGYFPSMYEI